MSGSAERPLVEVRDLRTWFPVKNGVLGRERRYVRAVDGVSFAIPRATTMGLVGESGCGKSTTGRTILRLMPKTAGEVIFDGLDVYAQDRHAMNRLRTKMQLIFQDPYSSLSPRMPVGELIGEAVRAHGIVPRTEHDAYIARIMQQCGLPAYYKERYPHEFSGGQRQRICIARALALGPSFVVCDEPVSALDVSIQAQIINLLKELQKELGLTYLFISHDLSVVEHICDTVGIMYLGNIVEYGSRDDVFREPLHPYTRALFSAIPVPDPETQTRRVVLEGNMPSPADPPGGCKFHTRCPQAREVCKSVEPPCCRMENGRIVRCHLYDGIRYDGERVEKNF